MSNKRQQASNDILSVTKIEKRKITKQSTGFLHLKSLDTPFISPGPTTTTTTTCLNSNRIYTIGRNTDYCDIVFNDPRVSNRHCQIFVDGSARKIFIFDGFKIRSSLNGVFANGLRIGEGKFVELSVGDEVNFVCNSNSNSNNHVKKIGFVIERLVFTEDFFALTENKRLLSGFINGDPTGRAVFLLNRCRMILESADPISFIRNELSLDNVDCVGTFDMNAEQVLISSSSGKKFFLNRLQEENRLVDDQEEMVVSLPELLHPVETLTRMFIATFTCDILWFLQYCKVPNNLPVTIACHNTERCWSSSPDKRMSAPFENFPNLLVIYPPFPDVIAFGKDRKKQGIACHHPKLLVLQRDSSIRIVVTSANLVSKQWNSVTNTVWWQDFPRRCQPDYSALFTSTEEGKMEGFKSDFAAQLAGFMASLVVDVPSEAYWITELTKYEFGGANGYLIASVPGMHSHKTPYPLESNFFLSGNHCVARLNRIKFLGSVEASLVGLKHRFHSAADSNGAALKTLAAFLRQCRENEFGMLEVVLRRYKNIPADANAVSVLICDLDEFSEGDYIQLGFLPRDIAKWVAPLCDAGFFCFSAYIYPKEVLAAALEGSNNKVQLIMYVSQGPCFTEISSLFCTEHVASICSLVASLQRCVGLSRLQEVLRQYNWPELEETDFVYGSSSIGTSINLQFLAAFSSAAGKMSTQFPESDESDPEWGRWNANAEFKNPSMRIIFPTIERVKDASCGIRPFRRLLCLSEGTWQRLRSADIFHDAIPYPSHRVGYPMHVKVARRRFYSNTNSSSFGWVYCGSHNFSPAAWGRPTTSTGLKFGVAETNCSLGARLHVCNYELGIIFIVPPVNISEEISQQNLSFDDITLPFILPAPKYRPRDRAATAKAMREAVAELAEREVNEEHEVVKEMMDEIPEEGEMVEVAEYVSEEKEEEKAYAETLWSQVDSADN